MSTMSFETPPTEEQQQEQQKISPEAIAKYLASVEQLAEQCGQLQHILHERVENDFNELIDENDIARLGAMQTLKDLKPEDTKNVEEIMATLGQANSVVETIGTIQNRTLNDDPENLALVSTALMKISEEAQNVSLQLKSMETPEAVEAGKLAEQLRDIAIDRQMAILKKKESLEDYLSR